MIKENYNLADGSFSHNGWMQELPHPVSKIMWDNYAALSEKTCKDLGVKNNDVIEIKVGNRKLSLPVFMQAGTADEVIVIESGFGRTNSGTVANEVGFNSNVLLSKSTNYSPWIYSGVEVTKTGDTYELASSQEHHAFDDPRTKDLHKTRNIIQEATVAAYAKKSSYHKRKTSW